MLKQRALGPITEEVITRISRELNIREKEEVRIFKLDLRYAYVYLVSSPKSTL